MMPTPTPTPPTSPQRTRATPPPRRRIHVRVGTPPREPVEHPPAPPPPPPKEEVAEDADEEAAFVSEDIVQEEEPKTADPTPKSPVRNRVPIREMKAALAAVGLDTRQCVEREDLEALYGALNSSKRPRIEITDEDEDENLPDDLPERSVHVVRSLRRVTFRGERTGPPGAIAPVARAGHRREPRVALRRQPRRALGQTPPTPSSNARHKASAKAKARANLQHAPCTHTPPRTTRVNAGVRRQTRARRALARGHVRGVRLLGPRSARGVREVCRSRPGPRPRVRHRRMGRARVRVRVR